MSIESERRHREKARAQSLDPEMKHVIEEEARKAVVARVTSYGQAYEVLTRAVDAYYRAHIEALDE